MNTQRRDLLKLFGVGVSIIPIINGGPVMAAEAKLIEEPNVELTPRSVHVPHLAARLEPDMLDDAVQYFRDMHNLSPVFPSPTLYQHVLCLPHLGPALLDHSRRWTEPVAVWELRYTKIPGKPARTL